MDNMIYTIAQTALSRLRSFCIGRIFHIILCLEESYSKFEVGVTVTIRQLFRRQYPGFAKLVSKKVSK